VVIVGITGAGLMTILSSLVSSPTLLAAMIVKLNVPSVVGVPVITLLSEFKLNPGGKLPLTISHDIGAVPETERDCL